MILRKVGSLSLDLVFSYGLRFDIKLALILLKFCERISCVPLSHCYDLTDIFMFV